MTADRLSRATEAGTEFEVAVPAIATCPLCHTAHLTLTVAALEVGADWRCLRCGLRWDAERLALRAAYVAWALAREALIPAIPATHRARANAAGL